MQLNQRSKPRVFGACLAAAATAMMFVGSASAQLSNYSQDFEALGLAGVDNGALAADGWLVSGLVFNSGGGFKFFYGNFPAPNDGGASFSAVATGEAGPAQGLQYINTFSDYNCCGAGTTNEGHFNGTDIVENNIFQEQVIGAGDIGKSVNFSFDGKLPGNPNDALALPSNGIALIRTLDPNNNFAQTNLVTFDALTLADDTWSSHLLTLSLADPALQGQILQFGFNNRSSNFDPTGVLYDNINFSVVPEPASFVLLGLGALALPYRRRARLA